MSAPDMSRRFFLRGKVAASAPLVVRPPWALPEARFTEQCKRCDDCIDACPEKIIVQGDGGFPEVNFKLGECTFCARCAESCEAGAFHYFDAGNSISRSDDQQHDICAKPANAWDLVVAIRPNCLAMNAIVCRACGDNCEEQAIRFQLKPGGVSEPIISQEECTGCGACVAVCPVDSVSIKPAGAG